MEQKQKLPAGNSIRDRVKELRRVPGSQLRANPKNWRKHPQEQRDALRAILNQIGFAGACLARELPDKSLELIDGHLRTEDAGDAPIPVLILDVTEQEADLLLATFDPLSSMAQTDAAQLQTLLSGLKPEGDALESMLRDLAAKNPLPVPESPADIDDIPEPPNEPITKPGDLWILGNHRLLCGDSTNEKDLGRLLEGRKAQVCFTDPPYGVSAGAKNRMLNTFQPSERCLIDIVDDDLSPGELEERLLPAFVNARKIAMADDCTLLVCSPQGGELSMMMMMMEKAGLKPRHVIIWKKNQPTFSMNRLDYDYQHEPILLTWGKRHKRPMRGSHKTSVWEVDKPRSSSDHPTMKPVELYVNAYLNHSDAGDSAFEPYAGSGTAFLAAEQTDRICLGVEIDPKFCDVTIQRWEKLTGKKATLENRERAEVKS